MYKTSELVIGCAIKVHRRLGPGLLESVYEECLSYELTNAGIYFERQKPMPVVYDQIRLDAGYRTNLLVNHDLVVELKSVDSLLPIHLAQTMTYLRLANCRYGLILNFNVAVLAEGIKRVVNGY